MMTQELHGSGAKPILTAGIFYAILLEAQKPKGQESKKKSQTPQVQMLQELVYVVTDTKATVDKAAASRYKNCKRTDSLFAKKDLEAFGEAMKNNNTREAIFKRMKHLVDTQLDTTKVDRVVKIFLDLLDEDDEAKIFYSEQYAGTLLDENRSARVCLEPFLVGLWHYAASKPGGEVFYLENWINVKNKAIYSGKLGTSIEKVTIDRYEGSEQTVSDYPADQLREEISACTQNLPGMTFENLRPVFSVLCCAYAPIPREWLLSKFSNTLINKILKAFTKYVTEEEKNVSIDSNVKRWLENSTDVSYHIDKKFGHECLADFCKGNSEYALRYRFEHCYLGGDLNGACSCLADGDFQKQRWDLKSLGGEDAVRAYFDELKRVSRKSREKAKEVTKSECFKEIFAEHRRYLYRSGLFFDLKECGIYSGVLKRENPDNWSRELTAANALFLYSTEKYTDAKPFLEAALKKTDGAERLEDEDELNNMLALCYLKSTNFEEAERLYGQTLKAGGDPVDTASAYINLGRIHIYKQEDDWWEKAAKCFDTGFEELTTEIKVQQRVNQKAADRLYVVLAEYYRIAGLAGLFAGEVDYAKTKIEQAEIIHLRFKKKGRYFARFLILQAAVELFRQNITREELWEIDSKLEKITFSGWMVKDFEQIGIEFWRGVVAYQLGETEKAIQFMTNASTAADAIDSRVELAEAGAVLDILEGTQLLEKMLRKYSGREYLKTWAEHVASVVLSCQRVLNTRVEKR